MPIHSLIMVNRAGKTLFKKYYDESEDEDSILMFEQALLVNSHHLWPEAPSAEQVLSIEDLSIVVSGLNDIVLMIAGNEEYNEMMLADIAQCVLAVLGELCGGRERVSEFRLLKPEIYGKYSVCLDHMIFQVRREAAPREGATSLTALPNPFCPSPFAGTTGANGSCYHPPSLKAKVSLVPSGKVHPRPL